jgi:tetratricopeptide (TPR) repeat protein
VEQGKLVDSKGEFRKDLEPDSVDLPRSLRLVISRRLARLSVAARRTLAAAAIAGRYFTVRLLEASMRKEADTLLDSIEEGERTGLISSSLEYPEARFKFSHELIRQAVIGELSEVRRQRLHADVADAIERVYSDTKDEHADDLAHHLWQAGSTADFSKAVHYLALAAKQASARSANQDAITQLTRALDLLQGSIDSPLRREQELDLQLSIGTVQTFAKGYSAVEVERAFGRARQLCQQVGESSYLFHVLRGLASYYCVRGDYQATYELLQQSLPLAQRLNEPLPLLAAHMLMGSWLCWMGRFPESLEQLERCSAFHDPKSQDPMLECSDKITASPIYPECHTSYGS